MPAHDRERTAERGKFVVGCIAASGSVNLHCSQARNQPEMQHGPRQRGRDKLFSRGGVGGRENLRFLRERAQALDPGTTGN